VVRGSTPGTRRKVVVAALAAGALAGALLGAAVLSGAAPDARSGPRPQILHAAPAVVDAQTAVMLGAATVCRDPGAPSCEVRAAQLFVQPAGTSGWSTVQGESSLGGFRFTIPGTLVPADGFAYWLRMTTQDGGRLEYPPGGQSAALRVLTTAGLPTRRIPDAFSWADERRPDGRVATLPYGAGDGEVGRAGGRAGEAVSGPSSFDVGPDGSVWVVDWVNRRLEVLSAQGTYRRAFPVPDGVPMDLAVTSTGGAYLAGLGTDARVTELDVAGKTVGRYPIGFGVSARISATPTGPRVFVGPAQWVAVSMQAGVPMSAESQAAAVTSAVPLPDGGVGLAAQVAPSRFAAVWSRPDGSRCGAVVKLPNGIRPGSDYFVHPLPDGGAVVAQGLWDDTHAGVGVFRFDATGRISAFSLLPEPTSQQAARFSTVRFRAPGDILVAYGDHHAYTIERFEVR
jgi:hypothetical protein